MGSEGRVDGQRHRSPFAYNLIPRAPYWFRKLEYRFPTKLVYRTVRRHPAAWWPTWFSDLFIITTRRWFVAYQGGDGRMTSRLRQVLDEMDAKHRHRMATDPEYVAERERQWERIRSHALPIEEAHGVSKAAQQAPSSEPDQGPSPQADGARRQAAKGAS